MRQRENEDRPGEIEEKPCCLVCKETLDLRTVAFGHLPVAPVYVCGSCLGTFLSFGKTLQRALRSRLYEK